MNRLKAILLCAAVVTFVSFVSFAALASSGEPESKRPRQPVSGRAVYSNNCARCHGGDGTSHTTMGEMTQARDLTDAAWQSRRSTARMIASVTNGRGEMPAFKRKLSRQEIAAAVAYVRTLKR